MPTEIISTIDPGGGGDYLTLAAWEAATDNDLVAADEIQVAELVAGTHTLTGSVNISGATTNAECYRVIRAQAGAEYSPITGTGAKVVQTGDDNIIEVYEQGLRLCDFAIEMGGSAQTAARIGIQVLADLTNSNATPLLFDGLTALISTSADFAHVAFDLRSDAAAAGISADIYARNCVAIGNGTATANWDRGFETQVNATYAVFLDNCDAYGCETGVRLPDDSENNVVRNVANAGSVTADFAYPSGTTNLTLQSLASEDATAIGTGAVTGINPATAFRNAANNDFRLAAGSPLIDAGVDLSDLFTTDIRGQSYGDTWNIGAYAGPALDSVVTKTGWSRADDIRIETFTITDATTVAVLDTTGYDSVHIIPLGGVGTDPTSGTLTFVPYAVAMKSGPFDPASSEEWARLGNSARIINRATITSTAVGHGYITTPPQYIVLAPSGGTGWANVPVRVEYRKSKEHWQRVGRG